MRSNRQVTLRFSIMNVDASTCVKANITGRRNPPPRPARTDTLAAYFVASSPILRSPSSRREQPLYGP